MYNVFGFHLFAQLLGKGGDNVFMSPASVAFALAIAANGAGGSTRGAILGALGHPNASIAAFNVENRQLITGLSASASGVQFSLANAVWLNPAFPLRPQFVSTASGVFGATARNLNFGDPSAAATINDWVKQHTNGRIPKIVESTDVRDVSVITNAIAMKAKWVTPFKKSETRDGPFTTAEEKQITVSMMHEEANLSYAQIGDWQIARLPYSGNHLSMYVFLPREGVPLTTALQKLDDGTFETAIAKLGEQQVALTMPRFTATYEARLNQALSNLGMAQAFGPQADFSNLTESEQRAYISSVLHKAFVRVDEEGTEAAAATAVTIQALAVHIAPPPIQMIVDRPFLMVIRDDTTREILFLGAIYDPKTASG
jgi:serine protease inhibitor